MNAIGRSGVSVELHKINVKIAGLNNTNTWVHFCYVPYALKLAFDAKMEVTGQHEWVQHWAKEDFNMSIGRVMTESNLIELRQLIKDRYHTLYPDIFIDSITDNQGWGRVWYTTNMKNEMAK